MPAAHPSHDNQERLHGAKSPSTGSHCCRGGDLVAPFAVLKAGESPATLRWKALSQTQPGSHRPQGPLPSGASPLSCSLRTACSPSAQEPPFLNSPRRAHLSAPRLLLPPLMSFLSFNSAHLMAPKCRLPTEALPDPSPSHQNWTLLHCISGICTSGSRITVVRGGLLSAPTGPQLPEGRGTEHPTAPIPASCTAGLHQGWLSPRGCPRPSVGKQALPDAHTVTSAPRPLRTASPGQR